MDLDPEFNSGLELGDEGFDFGEDQFEDNGPLGEQEVLSVSTVESKIDLFPQSFEALSKNIDDVLEYAPSVKTPKEKPINKTELPPDELVELSTYAQKEAQAWKIFFDYLQSRSFDEVKKEDVIDYNTCKVTNPETQESLSFNGCEIENMILLLMKNEYIKKDTDLLKKLHKLKPVSELVNTSMLYDGFGTKLNTLKTILWDKLIKYQTLSKEEIHRKELSLQDFHISKKEENVDITKINELEEEIQELKTELQEAQMLIESLKNKEVTQELDILDMLQKLNYPYLGEIELDDEETLQTFLAKVEYVLEEKTRTIEDNDSQHEQVADHEEEIQLLKNDISNKENLIESMKKEIEALTISNEEVKQEVKQEIDNEDEEKKSGGLFKKILFGFFVVIILLAIFLVGAYYYLGINEEDSASQKNTMIQPQTKQQSPYLEPIVKPEPAQKEPSAPIQPVMPKTPQEVAPTTKPIVAPAALVETHDFNKEMTLAEFQNLNFDIYDIYKIRVEGRDFMRGDVINGFTFYKARSDGMLFFSKNGTPVSFEMKSKNVRVSQ